MNAIDKLVLQTRAATCEHHGDYQSRNVFGSIWSRCPECEQARQEKENADKALREREERRRRWEQKLGESGIPYRFRDRRLADYVADNEGKKRALAFAENFSAGFERQAYMTGQSAVFVGKPGTGKTHLAAGIGLALMEDGYSVLFCTVMRAIRRVKDTWGGNRGQTESEAIAALVEPDLLILDEVGVQFGSETEKLIMFDILNERYEKRKSCLLLSNLSTDEVFAFLGERILDRMKEDGGEVIPFNWESYRGNA